MKAAKTGRKQAKPTSPLAILKATGQDYVDDKVPRLAAALAYYTLFAIAPLLLIVIGLAGLVFGTEAVQGQLSAQISGLVGQGAADAIEAMVAAAAKPGAGVLAAIVGGGLLVITAGGVFGQLQDALNTIWEVKPRKDLAWWKKLLLRFRAFSMILGVLFLLLVSLVVSAALGALSSMVRGWFPEAGAILTVVDLVVTTLVLTAVFAMTFKLLPQARVEWRDVWVGALATAVLFQVGKYAIGLYLGSKDLDTSFGAAAGIVVILLWVYYASQIVLLGAEFTQAWATAHGRHVAPSADARPAEPDERAKEGLDTTTRRPDAVPRGARSASGPRHPVAASASPIAAPPPVVAASQPRVTTIQTPPAAPGPTGRMAREASSASIAKRPVSKRGAALATAGAFLAALLVKRAKAREREGTRDVDLDGHESS